jgi:hypothetical protein
MARPLIAIRANAGTTGMVRGRVGYAPSENRKVQLLVLCARIGFTPPGTAS